MTKYYEFIYCPFCGSLGKTDQRLFKCSKNHEFYLNPATSNGVFLINEAGEVLLVRRKYEPKIGFWDTPGGFVDMDETFEDSAIREIKEELGIEIKKLEFLGSYVDEYLFKGINYQTLAVIFIARISNLEFKVSDDISEAKFFAVDKIPLDQIAFESIKKALVDYKVKN